MNNKLNIEATICHIGDVETVGSKGFNRRTVVLVEPADGDRKYPKHLALTLKGDNCNKVDSAHVGAKAKVVAYVESRAWDNPKTGKTQYFTDVVVVKLEIAQDAPTAAEPEAIPF